MNATIQVVRPFAGIELHINKYGIMSIGPGQPQEWLTVGVAIELTQERRDVAGQDDDGNLNGEDYVETRLVSEWGVKR